MNKIIIVGLALFLSIGAISCGTQRKSQSTSQQNNTITVTGKITKIENGKDGYMATIVDNKNNSYVATISIVNLQKSGGTYKRHEEGEQISVTGPYWKDEQGNRYITVEKLN